MKKFLTKMFMVTALSAMPILSNAQITYSKGNLNINNAKEEFDWGLFINEWPSMYWTCNNNNFFQLDVSPANPRLAGTGDQIVFYNTRTEAYNSIKVANVYNYSDARAKENVQDVTKGLSSILRLRPVSYTWKQDKQTKSASVKADSIGVSTHVANGPYNDNALQYGFLAQEVEEVIPDAVTTDESGNKLINYTAIIPLLVQAVQDLQATVEAQAQKIEQLSGQNGAVVDKVLKNRIISCTPNPTNGYVNISTKLEAETKDAYIIITNLSGTKEKELIVSPSLPTVTEDISSLDDGIYVASLYVNNTLCNSIRIIKE